MSEQPLVERLHAFFVQVFTTHDLFDKDKRQEMKLLSFELDDEVAQLEAENAALKLALTLIGDIGYDHDGYRTPHDLKKLIDEMVGYARNPLSAIDALLKEQEDE